MQGCVMAMSTYQDTRAAKKRGIKATRVLPIYRGLQNSNYVCIYSPVVFGQLHAKIQTLRGSRYLVVNRHGPPFVRLPYNALFFQGVWTPVFWDQEPHKRGVGGSRGPKDRIYGRILHSDSEAQQRGDSRNNWLCRNRIVAYHVYTIYHIP